MKKKNGNIFRIISIIMVFISTWLIFTVIWVFSTWKRVSMDELMFHIKAPITGTSSGVILRYICIYFIPAVIIAVLIICIHSYLQKKNRKKISFILISIYNSVVFIVSAVICEYKLDLASYLKNGSVYSEFIEENYKEPNLEEITFPETKRNLIYIYLESMEISYASEDVGGGFEENYIPELCEIAQENDCFSSDNDILNGSYMLSNTTWTMGAMFAQSTGLPLKVETGFNNLDTQDTFFPGVVSIGEILEYQGYKNILFIGSDATFGGRRLFFENHGNYEIRDYNYAMDNNYIPEDYYEFWGYEDKKLFEFAKHDLLELSKEDQPFNFTMLTVDTHAEDGYICDLCDDNFKDNQYANVIACSSRQVYDFIQWIKEQDFYDNTTIVLAGDHLTMDSDFCDNVSGNYLRRMYSVIINSSVDKQNIERKYSSVDLFPTTLAAMGADFQSQKLGLGVNLYSSEETIIEKYGIDLCNIEIAKKSRFMESLNSLNMNEQFANTVRNSSVVKCNDDDGYVNLEYYIIDNIDLQIIDNYNHLEMEVLTGEKKYTQTIKKVDKEQNKFFAKCKCKIVYPYTVRVNFVDNDGNRYICGEDCVFSHGNQSLLDLLSLLNNPNYVVFMSIKDDGTYSISDNDMKALYELGVKNNLQGQLRTSFYSIVSCGNNIDEKIGYRYLEGEGVIPDEKVTYEIKSGGFEYGNISSIIINNVEYSVNMRGLNIVVWDKLLDKVLYSVNYDTFNSDEEYTTIGSMLEKKIIN